MKHNNQLQNIITLEPKIAFSLKEFTTINIVLFFHFSNNIDWVTLKWSFYINRFINMTFRNEYIHHMIIVARLLDVTIIWFFCWLGIFNVCWRLWIGSGVCRFGIFSGLFRFGICSGGSSSDIRNTIRMNSSNGGCRFGICNGILILGRNIYVTCRLRMHILNYFLHVLCGLKYFGRWG